MNEQYSVEVVYLVANGLREKSLGIEFSPMSAFVLSSDAQSGWPFDRSEKTGKGEAALFEAGFSLAGDDLGVGEHDPRFGILADGEIDSRNAEVDAHLRCREASPRPGALQPVSKRSSISD